MAATQIGGRDGLPGEIASRPLQRHAAFLQAIDLGGGFEGLGDVLLVCATETTTSDDIGAFAEALAQELG